MKPVWVLTKDGIYMKFISDNFTLEVHDDAYYLCHHDTSILITKTEYEFMQMLLNPIERYVVFDDRGYILSHNGFKPKLYKGNPHLFSTTASAEMFCKRYKKPVTIKNIKVVYSLED